MGALRILVLRGVLSGVLGGLAVSGLAAAAISTAGLADSPPLTGAAAYGDWRADAPGVGRLIRPEELPPPYASRSASNSPGLVDRPAGATLHVPPGFAVREFAHGLSAPRQIRVAPNGDIFVAESGADRIRVLRDAADGATGPSVNQVFADGLNAPFGIAFYPPGPAPQYLYVANNSSVVRFPYRPGELKPLGRAEIVVQHLPAGGHWTRDVQFSADGSRMLVSVGSGSNDAQGLSRLDAAQRAAWEATHGLGAAWDGEENRAAVLAFAPTGGAPHPYATGLRNCVSLALEPRSGMPWCVTNERDGLGDDLPPDYVTAVREGGFYGWPWYYIGDHEDPRHKGERPDLASHVTVPDVLLQPHSAPLGIAFYDPPEGAPAAFPAEYRGDAFVALHGSWNRAKRTGYKLVRLPFKDGRPDGSYRDFLTGFVADDDDVWGRPVAVAVAHDGALLLTEDGNGTIWRVAPAGR
ncbi:sorbosone dehydrogenase [Aliidongia dinghuensis]|uniref:Sorbosone dehydrogenase n=1 Tax=Aliidongia dinghuensis TaxID=1867774 RepID=A0A8J2YU18_9PROT|nr:PQQ-dependent sugar dehydrogenase [Aliidongia dinghuensis]GGF16278.1 sorbosone dehydrogenase [Aliidongia dinghuensis]